MRTEAPTHEYIRRASSGSTRLFRVPLCGLGVLVNLSVTACSRNEKLARTEAIGMCYFMPNQGWTKPEGPILRIVKDPRHGREVYFAAGPNGAQLYLQPEAGRLVSCPVRSPETP